MKNKTVQIILPFLFGFAVIGCAASAENPNENKSESTKDSTVVQIPDSSILMKYPLITWLRKDPVEIGCMLEKEFGYRDSTFNCDRKKYKNNGDPCKNTKEYYEGIEFPENLAGKVHSSIRPIGFSFEHGNLRQLTITFSDSILKDEVKKIFDMPAHKAEFPDNIMDISYGENMYSKDKPVNEKYTRWLIIYGFEHMGAGDVDCE